MLLNSLVLLALYASAPARASSGDNATGSPLWDDLLEHCSSGPFACVQDRLKSFVERSLKEDINITQGLSFRRNRNNFVYSSRSPRKQSVEDPEFNSFIDSVEESENTVYGGGSSSPDPGIKYNVFGLGEILFNKGLGYLMNHDVHVSLPKFLGGGVLTVKPQSLDSDGALVRFKYDEPEESRDDDSSDLQPTGRIFFLKRIKKFFSKKLLAAFLAAILIIGLIKVKLLFFLPLILGVGAAKKILLKILLFVFPALAHLFKLCAYYHHQHVKFHHHHHQVAHHHHHIPIPVTPHSAGTYSELPEYLEHPPPGYTSRKDVVDVDLPAWGIDLPQDDYYSPVNNRRKYQDVNPAEYKYQDSLNTPPNIQKSAPSVQSTNVLALGGLYDPFYSPILEKLDDIFAQLGFQNEGCRERLVCSMYKAPARFSPHSNLVSAQLSRDPIELQKPGYTNAAVTRFYRYVHAAREGQEGKSCLTLYPQCTVITE